MLLAALLACVTDKHGGPVDGGDTGRTDTDPTDTDDPADTDPTDTDDPADTDPADTDPADPDPWEPWFPPCDRLRPRPVDAEALPTLGDLYGPDQLHLYGFRYSIDTYVDDLGCPTYTLDGDTETYEGSCAAEGFAWDGTWIVTETSEGGVDRWTDELVALSFEDPAWATLRVTADGFMSSEERDDGTYVDLRDIRMSIDGYGTSVDGVWSVVSSGRWEPADSHNTGQWYADVVPQDGPAGDYCVNIDTRRYEGCDIEPWGGWVLQAEATVVVAFDPDVACDGCANVTIDGVDAGQLCGRDAGAYGG